MKKTNSNPILLLMLLFFTNAFLWQNSALHAQNLVPNPGFEEYDEDSAIYWQHPGGGYYHFEKNSGYARTGNCLMALCDWGADPTEYVEVKLTSALVKDKKYRVTAYTMIKPEDERYINYDSARYMGLCFLKNPVNVHARLYIIKKPEKILYVHKDTLWHKTEFDYIARGNENYLIMGHFYDSTHIPQKAIDTNYQNYQIKLEILTLEKPETIKTEIEKINQKYKQIQADSWNIDKEKSPRKQEKLIRAYQKAMLNHKNEIRDKINEIDEEYKAKADELAEKYNIGPCRNSSLYKYRMCFDDISVEPAPESPPVQEQVIILNNVFFNTAEWILLPASFAELDKYVAYLQEEPNLKVEISGHTDIVGNDEDNQLLSEDRAKAVVEYFIQRGIEPERLTYKGYGRTKPIADNQTDEGRARNRRVEMKIISE